MKVTPDVPVRGEMTGDPATGAMTGQFHFNSKLVRHNLGLGSGNLREMDAFDGVLMHMQFHYEGSHHIDGSAVVVAPGVALCATHVISPHLNALASGSATCVCIGVTKSGLRIWSMHKATLVPDTDLCIITLIYRTHLPEDRSFAQGFLTTRLPRIGERLTLTGFTARSVEGVVGGTFVARGNVLACVGEVTAQYPQGRDSVMVPWPALEVDCQAWGGMSGGPVFDADGYVVGIVCSSFEGPDGHPISPAYVSLLWPAMVQTYDGGWPMQVFKGPHSLLEADRRVCSIERPEAITLTNDREDLKVKIAYWT